MCQYHLERASWELQTSSLYVGIRGPGGPELVHGHGHHIRLAASVRVSDCGMADGLLVRPFEVRGEHQHPGGGDGITRPVQLAETMAGQSGKIMKVRASSPAVGLESDKVSHQESGPTPNSWTQSKAASLRGKERQ